MPYALALLLALIGVLAARNYRSDIPLEKLKAKYATPPSRFVRLAPLDVHYRDEGPRTDSVPLVLLHGTGASLLTWNGWVREMKFQRRLIRMDLPGYGLTGATETETLSMASYVAFLQHFLDKMGVSRVDLAGNSLGGGIAWQYALAHPEQVRRLILIDAGGYPTQSESVPIAFRLARVPLLKNILVKITPRSLAERSLKNVYADDSKVTDPLIDQYYELALRPGNREAFIRRLGNPSPADWPKIAHIRAPTLILWGQQDGLIPVANAYRFHRDLPNDTLVILPNAGHVPMEELPDETAEIVLDFLSK